MNKKETNFTRLLLLSTLAIFVSGCQHQLSSAEREKTAQKITDLCTQGSNAIAKNDLTTAQKLFSEGAQQPGADNLLQTAWALEGLAFTESSKGKLDQSALHFQKAIAIYEAPPRGPMNPDLVRPLTSLGRVYRSQQKDADAKRTFTRAVQIATSKGPSVNTDYYMRSLLELGSLYLSEGQLPQAEKILRHALELKKYESKPNENRITQVVDTLSAVLAQEGKQQEAEALRTSNTL